MFDLIMSYCSRVTSQALPFSFEELKGWYNGYYTSDGSQLYNPWSIANALTDGVLRSYWTESGNKFSRFVCSWFVTHCFARLR
jgi:hypothetical protein